MTREEAIIAMVKDGKVIKCVFDGCPFYIKFVDGRFQYHSGEPYSERDLSGSFSFYDGDYYEIYEPQTPKKKYSPKKKYYLWATKDKGTVTQQLYDEEGVAIGGFHNGTIITTYYIKIEGTEVEI